MDYPNIERPTDVWTTGRPRQGTVFGLSRRRLIWIGGIGLLVLIGLIWLARSHQNAETKGGRFGAGGPMAVGVATAEKGDIDIDLNALGTVTPLATVTVRTQINGQLVQLGFIEGQLVHQGDFLAQIDPRPYQLQLEQAQGQLLRDQALLTNAKLDLARYQTLVRQDSIAHQQLDTQAALVRQDEGVVATDQANVDNAKLNLVYCHITAPVTGRVGLRQVDQGNYIQVGDTNGIVVITQLQPITVIFTLPEDNLPAIMRRVHAGAALKVTAYDRSNTTELATGTLTNVDNQVDTSTGTVKFRATFDNADESLFPNQFVNATLLVDTLHDQVIVPVAAIQRGAPGTFVYQVQPDATVAVKPVKLGPTEGQRVAIASGLATGDQVVTDGADKLRDGAKVLLPNTAQGQQPGQQGDPSQQPHRHRKQQDQQQP